LILTTSRGTDPKYLVSYRDLQSTNPEFIPLIDIFEAEYSFIANDATMFWFKTNFNAPKGRVVAIDIRSPSRTHWMEVIPESEDTLESVGAVDRKFILTYLKDARASVRICSLSGDLLAEVALPGIGTVGGFGGKLEDTETFYAFTSYTQPSTIYRYDMRSGQSTVFNKPVIQFNPDDYQTEQVFFLSKDGTRIPMFIVHRKDIAMNGNNRVYLYGYGGFNVSMTPAFSVSALVWMELGGVFAVANLRGGGEFGEEWHRAGTHDRKQNVFDDFIAAAEWLIANGYTSPANLAIGGGSNGGLLVTACMVQRPELFGAVMPSVGVMDMLRFHKFTIGWAWVDDYGSPDNPDEFPILFAYSPLHNLKPGIQYPSVLITTGDHDDRVVPSHSFKFAAALQAAHSGETPVLIRIETKAGHGAGKPTNKVIDEIADKWSFLAKVLA
jgi:prolyl oligopeptidase